MFREIKEKIQRESKKVNSAISVIAILLLAWLLFDLYRDSKGSGEPIGKVTQKVQKVNRKFHQQNVWSDLKSLTDVYNLDTIRTDDNSKLSILFEDKTEIEIEENSMVILNFSGGSLNLNLVNGGLNLNSLGSTGKNVKITSGESEILMDKGALKIAKSYDSLMDVNILEGKAEFKKGEVKQEIFKNEELKVRGEKINKEIKKFRLIQPKNSRILLTSTNQTEINFEWEGEEENYILEIFSLSGSIKKVFEQKVNGFIFSKELPPGKYSWKLSDSKRKDTLTEVFFVADESPARALTPPDGTVFTYSEDLPKIFFSWNKNEFNQVYQLEIAKSRAFIQPEIRFESVNESTVVDTLSEGKYYFRILSKTDFSDANPKISRTGSFTIQKQKGPAKPELIAPQNREQIALKGRLRFAWKEQAEFSHFRIQIAKDKSFASVYKVQEIEVNSMEWQESFSEGEYFWRVEGKKRGTQVWVASDIRSFSITSTPRAMFAINLDSPKNGEEISGENVTFAWKGNLEKNYTLEISNTPNFQNIIKTTQTKKQNQVLPALPQNEYYWRVKANVEEDYTVYSEVFSFYVFRLTSPVIEIPKPPAEFDVLKTKRALFKWKRQENVISYNIEIWKEKEKILSENTKRTEWEIDDLTKFKPGNYTFKLFANATGREGKVIPSKPSLLNFKIFLSETIHKEDVKFKSPETIYVE